MPFALTTDSIASGYTQQNVADKIVALLTAAIGAPINRYSVSTTLRAVFGPLPKAQGTDKAAYLVVDVTSGFAISFALTPSFSAPSTTGTLTTQSSRAYATNSSNINLTLFYKAGEGLLLYTQQGSTLGFFGYIMFPNTPSWWDRAVLAPIALLSNFTLSTFALFASPDGPSMGSAAVSFGKPASGLQNVNAVTGKRDVVTGVYFFTPNGGIGRSSDDWACCAASSQQMLDVFQVTAGSEEYTLLETSTSALALRTA